MHIHRSLLAIAFAAVVVLGLMSLTPVPGVAASGPSVQAVANQPDFSADCSTAVAQCIPCSPKQPCTNPLTVCSYSNPHHGCCIGYAG
jgi:hypothetical protein